MNPVIGLDVAKGESQVQAFLEKGKPYGKSFGIIHTREGLDTFLLFLQEGFFEDVVGIPYFQGSFGLKRN